MVQFFEDRRLGRQLDAFLDEAPDLLPSSSESVVSKALSGPSRFPYMRSSMIRPSAVPACCNRTAGGSDSQCCGNDRGRATGIERGELVVAQLLDSSGCRME